MEIVDTLSESSKSLDGKKTQSDETRKVSEILASIFRNTPLAGCRPGQRFVGPCLLTNSKCHAVRFDWNGRCGHHQKRVRPSQ